MKVVSFRIQDYRSIKDSGTCYLSGDNITILAGKNESGKTTILEALEDFNRERQIRDNAIPLNNRDAKPEISIVFEIDEGTIDDICDEIGIESRASKPIIITYVRKYPSKYTYMLNSDDRRIIGIQEEQSLKLQQREITKNYKRLKTTHSEYPQIDVPLPEINPDDIETCHAVLVDFRTNIQPQLPQISDETKRNDFVEALEQAIEKAEAITVQKSALQNFIEALLRRLPNFILYSSFEDIFPSEISLNEASENDLVNDLKKVSDLDLDIVTSSSASSKATHKKKINVKLTDDYKNFWEQDLTNLCIDWDSDNLHFFVTEGDDYYPPSMRSKGKQWHLAFYIRVSARAREDVPNIILIDEPGLFLHAQAQKDVMRKLEDCANHTQIIFSTHSPYLIDINRLNRIRLISRPIGQEGTAISNKIHKDADKETLTPIITAIGLDLSIGLDIAKNNNIIVEGISDYYYLQAFHELLRFEFASETHLIPGSGADKANLLASLMIGWGFNYCVVLDNDLQGRRIQNRLLKNFRHTDIKIIMVSDNKDEEIEDLFTGHDFAKYVLNEDYDSSLVNKKNSQLVKKNKGYDKVLLSKAFFEKVRSGEIQLSVKTKGNFKKLLQKIDRSMFPPDRL